MSQKDLSYSADLDRSYIASVENGKRNISIVNIEKIAIALEVSVKEFFNNVIGLITIDTEIKFEGLEWSTFSEKLITIYQTRFGTVILS